MDRVVGAGNDVTSELTDVGVEEVPPTFRRAILSSRDVPLEMSDLEHRISDFRVQLQRTITGRASWVPSSNTGTQSASSPCPPLLRRRGKAIYTYFIVFHFLTCSLIDSLRPPNGQAVVDVSNGRVVDMTHRR